MSVLAIGPEHDALIKALIAKSSAQIIPYSLIKKLAANLAEQGRTPELAKVNNDVTMKLPVGYRVTLTYEEQRPGVVCRHISISGARGVHPAAVQMIAEAFGFKNPWMKCGCWEERIGSGNFDYAINVIEPVDGDLMKLAKEEKGTSPA